MTVLLGLADNEKESPLPTTSRQSKHTHGSQVLLRGAALRSLGIFVMYPTLRDVSNIFIS